MSLPYPPCCNPPLSIPFCPSLLLFLFLGASGHRILFVFHLFPCLFPLLSQTCFRSIYCCSMLFLSPGTFGTPSSPCFPSVSVLLPLLPPICCLSSLSFAVFFLCARGKGFLLAFHLFPYLSPCLFATSLLTSPSPLRFCSGCFRLNLFVSRSSLLSPLLSVLRSGGFWAQDSPCDPSVSTLIFLLLFSLWLFALSVSGAQYAPCPLSVSVLVPLVPFNSCPSRSVSLSLFLFFSLGAFVDTYCLRLGSHLFPYLSFLFSLEIQNKKWKKSKNMY